MKTSQYNNIFQKVEQTNYHAKFHNHFFVTIFNKTSLLIDKV